MSDQTTTWMDDAFDPSIEDAPTQTLPSLAAPAVFLDPDAPQQDAATTAGDAASPPAAIPASAAPETLAVLKDEPPADLWAEPLPDEDVRTLRSLLFGGEPRADGERLAAIERRLDELAQPHAPERPQGEESARLAAIEQRLDALARQLDETHRAARAGDVTLQSLAELQRQIQDLRLDQAHATVDLVAQVRQADDRCRLRQRRARASVRLELLQLRRRVYARPQGQGQPQTRRATRRAVATGAPAAAAEQPEGEMDARTAWRAVRSAAAALAHALFALIVVLAHLAAEDMRAAGQQLAGLFRRR